jgi:tetratricopeptide (TPR) repeat protein
MGWFPARRGAGGGAGRILLDRNGSRISVEWTTVPAVTASTRLSRKNSPGIHFPARMLSARWAAVGFVMAAANRRGWICASTFDADARYHQAEAPGPARAAASLGLWCATCGLAGLGRAYKAAGEPDSSIAANERYVGTPCIARIDTDAMQLAEVYKDLGELYAARNDRKKAALYYTRFTELWRNCDQELKPQVADIKRLISGLAKEF